MTKRRRRVRKFFLTVGYSGLSPIASGTVGTAVALPIGILILQFVPPATLLLLSILITLIAINEINKYETYYDIHDPSEIVIDELVGIWITLSMTNSIPIIWQIILSFIMFRFFDIWKPSIIGRIERKANGGISVMLDDVIAGFFAGVAVNGIWILIDKWF